MGFDVVYLPPIHPIGRINRKGRNNSLAARREDVGIPVGHRLRRGRSRRGPSPARDGRVVSLVRRERASSFGLEVALDLALQCAPDHPWVTEHPEWFTTLPDGTIAYAENPPKKYQDIYPLNFDNDPEGLRAEVLRVVLYWIAQGVKIFRVDNPHTKPIDFWHWLIWTVKQADPDVLFLAEAFTRPAVMHGLGTIGFTQSYTYFTWRTTARELREYCEELVDAADHMRPNFWPNTPDILHETLQHGGPAMFKIRAILASLLSPSWGMYAGYELYEHVARPGAEEYLDNEKYQLRPAALGRGRAGGRVAGPVHRAAQQRSGGPTRPCTGCAICASTTSTTTPILCWSKRDPDSRQHRAGVVLARLAQCALGQHDARHARPRLRLARAVTVRDELTGASFVWGQHNAVRLDPVRRAGARAHRAPQPFVTATS